MFVRCKSIESNIGTMRSLTIDKVYKVFDIDTIGYKVEDDNSNIYWYIKEAFYSVNEERDIKINNILSTNYKID